MPNLASQFLDNVKWQKLFAQHIKGMKNIESMKLDSDALLDILRRRFDSHYEAHKMESLREHSCFHGHHIVYRGYVQQWSMRAISKKIIVANVLHHQQHY